jgi:hypothetical protein
VPTVTAQFPFFIFHVTDAVIDTHSVALLVPPKTKSAIVYYSEMVHSYVLVLLHRGDLSLPQFLRLPGATIKLVVFHILYIKFLH